MREDSFSHRKTALHLIREFAAGDCRTKEVRQLRRRRQTARWRRLRHVNISQIKVLWDLCWIIILISKIKTVPFYRQFDESVWKRNCLFYFLIFLFEFKNIILHFFQSFLWWSILRDLRYDVLFLYQAGPDRSVLVFDHDMGFLIFGKWFSKISAVLFMQIGTIGQPVFVAILKAPSLNGRRESSAPVLRVPSGKMQIEIPRLM